MSMPHQVLGLVRAGNHYYLVNSRDVEWTARTRLHLLALRLRETYLTPERQETGAAPSFARTFEHKWFLIGQSIICFVTPASPKCRQRLMRRTKKVRMR